MKDVKKTEQEEQEHCYIYLLENYSNYLTTCWLSGERSLPFGLLVLFCFCFFPYRNFCHKYKDKDIGNANYSNLFL